MIRFKTFSIEEKLLVQAVLSDFFNSVMSVGVVAMTWNLRSLAPDNSDVKALQDFVSYVGDLQVELGVELAIAGIPEDMRLNAPISKTVFQSMSEDKKEIVQELLILLVEKLGELKMFGSQIYVNIWSNKLVR